MLGKRTLVLTAAEVASLNSSRALSQSGVKGGFGAERWVCLEVNSRDSLAVTLEWNLEESAGHLLHSHSALLSLPHLVLAP